jgi:hypothetical protein
LCVRAMARSTFFHFLNALGPARLQFFTPSAKAQAEPFVMQLCDSGIMQLLLRASSS